MEKKYDDNVRGTQLGLILICDMIPTINIVSYYLKAY